MKKRNADLIASQYPPVQSKPAVEHRSHTRQKNQAGPLIAMVGGQRQDSISSADSALPTSIKSDSEEETYFGEPLVQDFAATNIPREFQPFSSKEASLAQDSAIDVPTPTQQPATMYSEERTGATTPQPDATRKAVDPPSTTT
jgi:hypothetical protein